MLELHILLLNILMENVKMLKVYVFIVLVVLGFGASGNKLKAGET